MKLRILLVDDHRLLRDDVREALEAAGEELRGGDDRDIIQLVDELHPDIVLMDLALPHVDTADTTRRIHEQHPETKVIVLTARNDVERTQEVLRSGAVGFLAENTPFPDVHRTLHAAGEGLTELTPELASSMLTVSEDAPRTEDHEPMLSTRQVEILQLIADGNTTKQVARELGIAAKTVHNHLNAIYRRLDTQNLTHAVLSAVRLGIIELD